MRIQTDLSLTHSQLLVVFAWVPTGESNMKLLGILILIIAQLLECQSAVRHKRQSPIANGEVITSIFQIPIQTLNSVHDLFQASRGRLQAIYQSYQTAQKNHPNHRPNPHFTWDRGNYNSKALVQPNDVPKRRYSDY